MIRETLSCQYRDNPSRSVLALGLNISYQLRLQACFFMKKNSFICLPRDAMHRARPMPSCGVCPSVTFVSCVKTNKDLRIFFTIG